MGTFVIGVAGGSCSGKTTFAKLAVKILGEERASVLRQDDYYLDQSDKFDRDGGTVNFDHPDAIEFSLLATHIKTIKAGSSIEVPQYDFTTHKRKIETVFFPVKEFVILDGTLILTQPEIVNLLDLAVYIQCDPTTRFQRRLKRDVEERGRTADGVKAQFDGQVQPMHELFVQPSQSQASVVLSQGEYLRNRKEILKSIFKDIGT